jgi:hypothetical protein
MNVHWKLQALIEEYDVKCCKLQLLNGSVIFESKKRINSCSHSQIPYRERMFGLFANNDFGTFEITNVQSKY